MVLQACVRGGLSAGAEEVVAVGHRPSITIGGRDSGSTHSCSDISEPSSRQRQQNSQQASGKGVVATWGGHQTRSEWHQIQSELACLRSGGKSS